MNIYANIILKNTTEDITLKNMNIMILNHITTFKFSNIDYFNKDFDLSYYPENTIDQVIKKRYGICMDLNYAFSLLLTERNYKNYLVKCYKPNSRS
jgi:arylamine N-acetyltransferase